MKKFKSNTNVQHITLELYSDSYFIEEVKEYFVHTKIWSIDISKNSLFKTIANKKRYQTTILNSFSKSSRNQIVTSKINKSTYSCIYSKKKQKNTSLCIAFNYRCKYSDAKLRNREQI